MAVSLKHSKTAIGDDNPDRQVSVSNWNAEHTLTGTANTVLGFDANGAATETTIIGSYAASVATRAALAALSSSQAAVNLRESGRDGLFVWDSSDVSAYVTADTQQGLYVPPSSDTTGASGAWVRRYYGPAFFKWFGAVADCTAAGSGTDNTAIFNAARAALIAAGKNWLHIGRGTYRFASAPSQIHDHIKITGDGWSENPGQVGATTYTGVAAYSGSILCFDTDVAGLQFVGYTDNNANATAFEFQSSIHSILRDVMLYSPGGTGITAHGIENRTVLDLDNVRIEGFAGYGVKTIAYASGANPYGSADQASYTRVSCRFNKLSGFYVEGDDANVMHFDGCDAAYNGGVGFLDKGSLGNTYTACHAATNNASFGTPAGYSAAQRTQNTTDWSGLSTSTSGSFVTTSATGAHVFDGCYTETGAGQKAELAVASIVFGGNLAGAASHTTSSLAARYNGAQILNIGDIYADTSGTVAVHGNGSFSNTSGNLTVTINPTGTYSLFNLYGGGLSANGLQILAGNGGAFYSANLHWFRSADQLTDFAVLDNTGLNLKTGIPLKFNGTTIINSSGVLQAAGFPALTGDVTTSAGSLATTIAAGAVTYAKFQQVAASSLVGNPTGSLANAQGITLAGGLAFSGTTLTVGALTPTSVASTGAVTSSSASAGVGYATGAGGTVTQATSRTTGVTLNKLSGAITLVSAAGSATFQTFTVTNSSVAATDTICVNQKSGTDLYHINVTNVAAGSFKISFATTGGTTTEQPVFQFNVIKGVNA